jgi:hypothetical protein
VLLKATNSQRVESRFKKTLYSMMLSLSVLVSPSN